MFLYVVLVSDASDSGAGSRSAEGGTPLALPCLRKLASALLHVYQHRITILMINFDSGHSVSISYY